MDNVHGVTHPSTPIGPLLATTMLLTTWLSRHVGPLPSMFTLFQTVMGKELQLRQGNFNVVSDETTELPEGVDPRSVVGSVKLKKKKGSFGVRCVPYKLHDGAFVAPEVQTLSLANQKLLTICRTH